MIFAAKVNILLMALIVIEGLDGAGKSTQINLLGSFLTQKGIASHFLHFPRVDAPYSGELIARFLRGDLGRIDEVDPYVVAMLYALDRMDASGLIKSWLNAGEVVLLDRYVYSNIAFQCAKLSDSSEVGKLRSWILNLEFSYFAIPQPDISLFLDVPFEFTSRRLTEQREGADRKYLNGKEDIHEKDLDFQQRVRDVYLMQQAFDPQFTVIPCYDGHGSMLKPDEIFSRVTETILSRKIIAY